MSRATERGRHGVPVVLAVVAGFGVLFTLINFATGAAIATAVGVPAAGGVVMFFLLPAVILLFRHILNRFYAATLVLGVFGFVALATPILGPPGFLPKVLIALAFGMIIDGAYNVTAFLGDRLVLRSAIAGIAFGYAGCAVIYLVFMCFLPPEPFEAFKKLLKLYLVLNLFEGALGGATAAYLYRKVEKRPAIRGFQT